MASLLTWILVIGFAFVTIMIFIMAEEAGEKAYEQDQSLDGFKIRYHKCMVECNDQHTPYCGYMIINNEQERDKIMRCVNICGDFCMVPFKEIEE